MIPCARSRLIAARQVTACPPEMTIASSASSSRYDSTKCGYFRPKTRANSSVFCPDHGYRVLHRPGPLKLQRRSLLGMDLRAVRHRPPRIQRERQLVRGQELVHLLRRGHVHLARDVRHEVAVLHHHLRQQHARVLADREGEQRLVEYLLGGRGPAHQPAHVPGAQRVGVLGAEVAGRVQGPVGDRHLDRDARPGDDGVHLVAVGDADPGRPGVGPGPAGSRAEGGGELRVLAVGVEVLGVQDPVGDELRQVHHDRRVRPDRVGGDHVDVRVQRRVRGRGASVLPDSRARQASQEPLSVGRPDGPVEPGRRPDADMHGGHGVTPCPFG